VAWGSCAPRGAGPVSVTAADTSTRARELRAPSDSAQKLLTRLSPAAPGSRVILQRQSRRRPDLWRPIAHGQVQADGSYTLMHAFGVSGPATLRVVVRARGLRATVSEPLTYEIAPRRSSASRGR
jgi:hypothetical protein